MNKYMVKTRNWNGKNGIAFRALCLSGLFGVHNDGNNNRDYDRKFWIETKNPVKAWLIWTWFMVWRNATGGWTYICRPGASCDENCKSIY